MPRQGLGDPGPTSLPWLPWSRFLGKPHTGQPARPEEENPLKEGTREHTDFPSSLGLIAALSGIAAEGATPLKSQLEPGLGSSC